MSEPDRTAMGVLRRGPVLLLGLGLLCAWLTPTRGAHDLNLLPEAGLLLMAGLAAVLAGWLGHRRGAAAAAAGLASGVPWSALFVAGWLLPMLVWSAWQRRDLYPELLLPPALGLLAGLLLILWAGQRQWQQAAAGDRFYQGVLLLGGLVTAGLVLLQKWHWPLWPGIVLMPPDGYPPFGNLMQRNLAALLMVCALSVAAQAYLSARRPSAWRDAGCLGAVLGCALAIAWTESRAGLLLSLVALLSIGALQPPCEGAVRRRRWLLLLALTLLGPALAAWSPAASVTHSSAERLVAGEGLAMRAQIMWHGLQQWREQPWFGGGWGSHPGWLHQHAEQLAWPRYSTHSHNLLTQLLAETGLIGTLPLLLVGLRTLGRHLRHPGRHQDPAAPVHATLVGVLLLHSLFEYPLWNSFFWLPFCWSFARLAGLTSERALGCTRSLNGLLIVGGLLLTGLTLWASARLLAAIDYRYAAQAAYRNGAVLSRPSGIDDFTADVIAQADPVLRQDQAAQRRQVGERLVRVAPMDWVIERLALDQALDGDAAASTRSWVRLCAMYPHRCTAARERLGRLAAALPLFRPIADAVVQQLQQRPAAAYDLRFGPGAD